MGKCALELFTLLPKKPCSCFFYREKTAYGENQRWGAAKAKNPTINISFKTYTIEIRSRQPADSNTNDFSGDSAQVLELVFFFF